VKTYYVRHGFAAATAIIAVACASEDNAKDSSSGVGGAPAAGGESSVGSGGLPADGVGGDSPALGGVPGSGGTGTGGDPGSGGSGVGGDPGSGGAGIGGDPGSGGAGIGGDPGSGGAGIGGDPGSGGTGVGGDPGIGGGGTGGATGSDACGASDWPAPCANSGSPCSMNVDGTDRTYYVQLPDDYDSNQAYPVVFLFHPMGGTAEMAMRMYNVRSNWPDAIYVSPQGLESDGTTGWPNSNGQDVAFTRAMMSELEASYCVDQDRYFSTGFSYGGIMSDTIACQMADLFRAIAPMAGSVFGGGCNPANPIAAWIEHGDADDVLPSSAGEAMRDILLETNHCSSTSHPVDPDPCVEYEGCDPGYPVVWCLVPGEGHAIPNFGGSAIAAFFQQF